MNEETEIITEEATPEVSSDDWDDIDLSDVQGIDEFTADPTEEADQQTPEEKPEESTEEAETAQAEAETPAADNEPTDTFELKHLGDVRKVNRDEVVTLAQKGLNYDHIKEERDTARNEIKRLTEMEDFLKELAADSGQTVEAVMDATRARMLMQKDKTLTNAQANAQVKLNRERAAFEKEKAAQAAEAQAKNAEQEKLTANLAKFSREYPDVKAQDIPQELWEGVREGGDLTALYAKYENKQLKAQMAELNKKLETATQNAKNAQRATGSRKTAGSTPAKDKWFDGWED